MPKMISREGIRKGIFVNSNQSTKREYVNKKPMKIARPPRVGIRTRCTVRLPGSSKRFFWRATLSMVGIDRKTMKKERSEANGINKRMV
jgi:hypothetical protein